MTETEMRKQLREVFAELTPEQRECLRQNQDKLRLAMFKKQIERNIAEMNFRLSFPINHLSDGGTL